MRAADFERMFAEHAQPLFGFLAYHTGDRALAEDLLGDTFERVVRAGSRFDSRKGGEKAWVYAIALNCLRDHQRRAGAEVRALQRAHAGSCEFDRSLDDVENRDLVSRGLHLLDPAERDILALRFGADLRLEDIARVTELPVSTVQGRLYRGLRRLRANLTVT